MNAKRSRRFSSFLVVILGLSMLSAIFEGSPVTASTGAQNDAYGTQMNQTLTVGAPGVLGNDSAPSSIRSLGVSNSPQHGSLILQENGSLTYTPDLGFVGTDRFWYSYFYDFDEDAALVTINVTRPFNFPSLQTGSLAVAVLGTSSGYVCLSGKPSTCKPATAYVSGKTRFNGVFYSSLPTGDHTVLLFVGNPTGKIKTPVASVTVRIRANTASGVSLQCSGNLCR